MKLIILLVTLLTFTLFTEGQGVEKVRYDGYKVVRVVPKDERELQILRQYQQKGMQFWREPTKVGQFVDLFLSPQEHERVFPNIKRSGLQFEDVINDYQKLAEEEAEKMATRSTRMSWDNYYDLDEIYSYLEEQASTHNTIARTLSIGQSTQGRELKVLKISKSGETKPAIFVDSNIHAREWITSALSTYLIDQLLNSNDTEMQSWTDDFDWYFLPIFNVDGFDYTHTTDRMWRKTLSIQPDSSCKGADANRNFGYHWIASSNPCSETFPGREAFSEPETAAVRDFLTQLGSRLVFYLTLHSYGQQIVIPYGYTHDTIPGEEIYMSLTKKAAEKHGERHGTKWTYGHSVGLYSGFSIDYVFGVLGTPMALLYELRDTGSYGFALPANQIIPSSQEFLDGLPVYIEALRNGNLTAFNR